MTHILPHPRPHPRPNAQRGAALLTALLTVALIAGLASAALRQQARLVESEIASRSSRQSDWLLLGASRWAALILREDARAQGNERVDHLGEPWAVPIQESKLSDFLLQGQAAQGSEPLVTLAGRIEDAQARLNLGNLAGTDALAQASALCLAQLFRQLNLPPDDLSRLQTGIRRAALPRASTDHSAPLRPNRVEQLVWLGVSEATVQALAPHTVWLPTPTPINLNTASAQVLSACIPGLDSSSAQWLVEQRSRQHFRDLEALQRLLGPRGKISPEVHALSSQYFDIHGQLRIEDQRLAQVFRVRRVQNQIEFLSRQAEALPPGPASALK